jgi:hypothetical protein
MKTISPTYASKIYLASELARLKCRAVTITSVARTKPNDSREIYRRIHSEQSESGQTPTNHNWFLQTHQRRIHAAIFLVFYNKYRTRYESTPDSHGIAFALALTKYTTMSNGDPVVSPERFNLLVGGFAIGWRDILRGGSSKYASENVKIIACKKCRMPILAEAHFLNYVCHDCNK